jgi:hypothetical protein
MDQSQTDAIKQDILTKLEYAVDREELVYYICNTYQLGWPAAEELVETVAVYNAKKINKHQSWLLLIVSIGGFLAGLAFAILYYHIYISPFTASAHSSNPGTSIMYLYRMGHDIIFLVIAMSLTVGGLLGIINATRTILT